MLVNNGGGPPAGPAAGVADDAVEGAVELLLLSVIRLTNLCLPHLETSGRGRIVNIESSSVRAPIDNLALSNALRPGVVGWMKTLAREVAPKGITVNTIAPGQIDTDRLRSLGGGEPGRRSHGPPGRRGGDRFRRLLPCLRPRGLRDRRGDPGRRRPHAQPALTRRLSPGRLLGAGAVLLAATVAVLWLWPSNEFLLLPDKAEPVAPLVQVRGGKDPTGPGQIYYDAIIIRRAKLFEQLFPWIHRDATLVPEQSVNPPGISDAERVKEDLREMSRSQDIAAAVALKHLGYKVVLRPTGARVTDVLPGSPAAKAGLEPTDVIVAVDGRPVRTTPDLRRLISRHKPGEIVRLSVRAPKGLEELRAPHGRRPDTTGSAR